MTEVENNRYISYTWHKLYMDNFRNGFILCSFKVPLAIPFTGTFNSYLSKINDEKSVT